MANPSAANNVQTVTASAVQLSSGAATSMAIWADSTNAANVYVGGPGVTTANGFPLTPGATITLDVGDAGAPFIIGTASDHVRWIAIGVSA